MACDEGLVRRLRVALQGQEQISEKTMFGGVSFLVTGHLAVCASSQGDLMVRVGPAALEQLLDEPGVTRMTMGSRVMKGWVRVACSAVEADADLKVWVDRGLDHARTLPAT